MIVLDASAAIDFLLAGGGHGGPLAERIVGASPDLAAPHLIDVETIQVLRRYVAKGLVSAERAALAIADLTDLPLQRYPHTPLLPRAFALRANLTMYDAIYLALAEALNAPLLTRDAALRGVPGCKASVEVLA